MSSSLLGATLRSGTIDILFHLLIINSIIIMEKFDIFTFCPNGVDEVYGVVIDHVTDAPVPTMEGDVETIYESYLCYAQNRLFYFSRFRHVRLMADGVKRVIEDDFTASEPIVEYVVMPKYDERLANWLEQQKMNHRMILIESTLGLSVEQEVAICEAIGKIVSPEENHLHVAFDRHFADKELVDKYNLVYSTIDE